MLMCSSEIVKAAGSNSIQTNYHPSPAAKDEVLRHLCETETKDD